MVLSSPIPPSAIIQDRAVCEFNEHVEQEQPTEKTIDQLRHQHCLNLISDLFDFSGIRHNLASMVRLMEESYAQLFPETLKRYQEHYNKFSDHVITVSDKFKKQYRRLILENESNDISPELQERRQKGAKYFFDELKPIQDFAKDILLTSDNKEVQKRTNNIEDELMQSLTQKNQLLAFVQLSGFHLTEFQKCRAILSAGNSIKPTGEIEVKTAPPTETTKKTSEKLTVPSEIQHPELYKTLYHWRNDLAKK